MKKIITSFALVVAAATLQAASIDWSISGVNSAIADYSGATAANTTIYLILADATSLSSITYDSVSNPLTESDFYSALSAITVATRTAGADGKKPTPSTGTVESPLLVAGNSYPMAMIYVSSSGADGYFRAVTATGNAYDPSIEGSSGGVGTSWSNMRNSSWTQAYSVPEPGIACMALLGVGMMLKRRRA